MFKIYPYKVGSRSVGVLKEGLNAKVIKLRNSRYRQRDNHIIINWGNSRRPAWMVTDNIINHPDAVSLAADKLETFERLHNDGIATVPFTTEKEEAEVWLDEGHKVFVRQTLTGHSGEGIEVAQQIVTERDRVIFEMVGILEAEGVHYGASILEELIPLTTLPDAPLYTRGISNAGEYRVHVMNSEVILYQKKSRRVDDNGDVITAEGEAVDVRNLASNWVYRTGNLKRLERVEQLAINTIESMGLDFGAVDIIKDADGNVFVLEVNTAPGLGNTDTREAYIEGFKKYEEQ